MNKYVCGFDENGKFLAGCVYKDESSLTRPKMLNRAVVLTEVVEPEAFDLYKQGYARGENGAPAAPVVPELTEEEKQAQALAKAKAERAEAVSKITVEVDGMTFDGDETAQTRMGRTIAAAIALGVDLTTYKQVWVLADNTVAEVTVSQLAQALKLAGEAQTALWTVPYSAEA